MKIKYILGLTSLVFLINTYGQKEYINHIETSFEKEVKFLPHLKIPFEFYRMMYLTDTITEVFCISDFYYNHEKKKMTCNCMPEKQMFRISAFGKTKINSILFIALNLKGISDKNILYTYDRKNRMLGVFYFKIGYNPYAFPDKINKDLFSFYSFIPFLNYKNKRIDCEMNWHSKMN